MDLFKLNKTCSFSTETATDGSCLCEFLPTQTGNSYINTTNNCTCTYNIKKLHDIKIILNGNNCSDSYIFTQNCTATALKNCTTFEVNCTSTNYNYKLDEESFHIVYNSSVCPNTNYSVIQLNSTKTESATVTTTMSTSSNNTTTLTTTSSSTSRTTTSGPTNLTHYQVTQVSQATVANVSSTTAQPPTLSSSKPSSTTTGRTTAGTPTKSPTVSAKAPSTSPPTTTRNITTNAVTTRSRVTTKTTTPSSRPSSTLSTIRGTAPRSSTSSVTTPVQSRASNSALTSQNGTNTSSTTARPSTVTPTKKVSVSPTASSSQKAISSSGSNNQTAQKSTTASAIASSVVSPTTMKQSSSSIAQNRTSGSTNSSVIGSNGATSVPFTTSKTPTPFVSQDNSTGNRTQNTSHATTYTGSTVKTTAATPGIQPQANTSTSSSNNKSQSMQTLIVPDNTSYNTSNSTLTSTLNYGLYSPVTMFITSSTENPYNATNGTAAVALVAGGGFFQNLQSELFHLYYIIPIILLMLIACLAFGFIKKKRSKNAYPPKAPVTRSVKRRTVRMSIAAPRSSYYETEYQSLTSHDDKDYTSETVLPGIKGKLINQKNDLDYQLINSHKDCNDAYGTNEKVLKHRSNNNNKNNSNNNHNSGNQVRKSENVPCQLSDKMLEIMNF